MCSRATRRRRRTRSPRHLFDEHGYAGNEADYTDPRNSYLDRVLDRRLGIPITLSVLMMEVARRNGVVLHGIGMPGHFLVGEPDGRTFYDPFHHGRQLDADGARDVFSADPGRRAVPRGVPGAGRSPRDPRPGARQPAAHASSTAARARRSGPRGCGCASPGSRRRSDARSPACSDRSGASPKPRRCSRSSCPISTRPTAARTARDAAALRARARTDAR